MPSCNIVVFIMGDMPASISSGRAWAQVIRQAEACWGVAADRRALAPRVSFARGDFFVPSTVPAAKAPGACYILRQILHDWPDDSALLILRSIRAAIGDSPSTLALVEVPRLLLHSMDF